MQEHQRRPRYQKDHSQSSSNSHKHQRKKKNATTTQHASKYGGERINMNEGSNERYTNKKSSGE
jgi:hypothetical protein